MRITDLTVRYGSRTVVDRLPLEIPPSGIIGLPEESGSGKSTVAPRDHRTAVVRYVCDHIAVPRQGPLIQECPIDRIATAPPSRKTPPHRVPAVRRGLVKKWSLGESNP